MARNARREAALEGAHERDVFHGPDQRLQVRWDRAQLVHFPCRGNCFSVGKPRHHGLGEPLLEALDGRRVKAPRLLLRLVPAVAKECERVSRLMLTLLKNSSGRPSAG